VACEDSDTPPQPRSDSDDDSRVLHFGNAQEPQAPLRQKPEWWTEAWESVPGVALSPLGVVQPVFPKEFRAGVLSDVFAFDQKGCKTGRDSTVAIIGPSEENELVSEVVGILWNDHHVTMTRYCRKAKTDKEMTLGNFANVVSSCPEGVILTFQARSVWLVREWDKMIQGKEIGDEELDRSDYAEPWSQIVRDIEYGHRLVQICVATGEEMPAFKEAAMKYAQEVVSHLEETLWRPVNECSRPVPPWS
jgi:hypothetical protein